MTLPTQLAIVAVSAVLVSAIGGAILALADRPRMRRIDGLHRPAQLSKRRSLGSWLAGSGSVERAP